MVTNKSDYAKNYYTNNKQKILFEMNKPVHCKYCATYVTKCNLSKHNKTKKHIINEAHVKSLIQLQDNYKENLKNEIQIIVQDLLLQKLN